MADSPAPAIVHCSAGIGRTGVLIAVDIGIQGVLQGDPKVDILRTVSTLRQDRAGMVQTRDQYRFIHQVGMFPCNVVDRGALELKERFQNITLTELSPRLEFHTGSI